METFLKYLQVRSFRRGLRGEDTVWFVVAAALWMLARALRSDDVVYRTKLRPGERLIVRAGAPDPSSSGS